MTSLEDIVDTISELRIEIGKAKGIAEAFAQEFIEPDTIERRVIAVQVAPDRHQYLFLALQRTLFEADQIIKALDGAEE